LFGSSLEIKSPEQVLLMREAGLVVADALAAVRDAVRPGVTTGDLDRVAADLIGSRGATPSFLGYGDPPFPATICASVNDAVVHGIPGRQVLAEGDVVSID
jgi:methionyl aminopeptidase